jgi:uncharacterized protein (DUF2252 family)
LKQTRAFPKDRHGLQLSLGGARLESVDVGRVTGEKRMSVTKMTAEYESWLRSVTNIDEGELNRKHNKMACSEFMFLRATFYRWAHSFSKHRPELCTAPKVLGVGDLHIENFGTWRDAEGRLSWGVNDFDEACYLPYTNDLVRLATSAFFALKDASKLSMNFKEACQAIQQGYVKGIEEPKPFILAEDHGWLRNIVIKKLVDDSSDKEVARKDDVFKKFHKKYRALDEIQGAVPSDARVVLNACFPEPTPDYHLGHREAGLGSLGRQRFTAVELDWQGGIIVREVKALAPSAWLWANQEQDEVYASALSARNIYYPTIVNKAVRSADPWLKIVDSWVVRRLGPDAFKVEIKDLDLKASNAEELTGKLLEAMGKELANVHSPSSGQSNDVAKHIKDLSSNNTSSEWLFDSAKIMAEQTTEDFHDWKKEGYECPPDEKGS